MPAFGLAYLFREDELFTIYVLQRKKAVKTGTASPKEFTDWLYQQSNVIVELTEI